MRVGIVGLGDMGKPMAERLAQTKAYALTVFDTRRTQVADVVNLGAVAADSLADLAAKSDLVGVVVRTADQVRSVILDSEGLLTRLSPGSIIAIHSTVSPDFIVEMAKHCAEYDVALLDVAVSGGSPAAIKGALTLMVGGDQDILEKCRPVFEMFSRSIFHLGGHGAGQAGKIVNNLSYNICVAAAAECIQLAVAAGIAEETAVALLRASAGTSYVIENWDRAMKHSRETADRLSSVRHKDVALALDLGRALDVETPLGAAASGRIDWAIGLDETLREMNENRNVRRTTIAERPSHFPGKELS